MLTKDSTPRQVRKAWFEALKSDEYPKCQGYLGWSNKGQERYCALGVLCELAHKAGVINRLQNPINGAFIYEGQTSQLPSAVQKWVGMRDSAGSLDNGESIIGYNDTPSQNGKVRNFNEIADIIKTCPAGLFTECDPEVEENTEVTADLTTS